MKWHYNLLSKFKEDVYRNVINNNNKIRQKHFDFDDIDESDWWWIIHNKTNYLISTKSSFPLKIKAEPVKKYIGSEIYYVCSETTPMSFKGEKYHSFKELVNEFASLKHTEPKYFLLYKLIFLTSLLTRINVRVCSPSNFGKDSVIKIGGDLLNNCISISPSSMASVEYRLFSRVLALNEVSLISQEEHNFVRKFLLLCGEFKNLYEKSTRGSKLHGTYDIYDLKNLSLILTYNPLSYYEERNKANQFFDMVFDYAVLDRFPAFLFKGSLDMAQFDVQDRYDYEYYRKITKSIIYYQENYEKELHNYDVDWDKLNLKGRHRIVFKRIVDTIDVYSETEQEFNELVDLLHSCYKNYWYMVKKMKTVTEFVEHPQKTEKKKYKELQINDDFAVGKYVEEIDIPDIQNSPNQMVIPNMEFIRNKILELCNNDEIMIVSIMQKLGIDEKQFDEQLNYLIRKAEIFQTKPGFIKRLN